MIDGASAGQIQLRFERRPSSARVARQSVAELLGDGPEISFVRNALLLTSELVSNAVLHGAGMCELRASYSSPPDQLRVEVHDESPVIPTVATDADQLARVGGLGLVLVDEVASEWGVESLPTGGKSVWFEISGETA